MNDPVALLVIVVVVCLGRVLVKSRHRTSSPDPVRRLMMAIKGEILWFTIVVVALWFTLPSFPVLSTFRRREIQDADDLQQLRIAVEQHNHALSRLTLCLTLFMMLMGAWLHRIATTISQFINKDGSGRLPNSADSLPEGGKQSRGQNPGAENISWKAPG